MGRHIQNNAAPRQVALLIGSLRADSINRCLALAITRLAPAHLRFTEVPMADLPYYNGDLEEARPESVRAFTRAIRAADAVCCLTPEYNRSIPGMVKNAIDWGSKPAAANVWRDKVFAMAGASPGGIGTAVAQQHLRQILSIQGCVVVPGETYVSLRSPGMITADGRVNDPSLAEFLTAFGARMALWIDRMNPEEQP